MKTTSGNLVWTEQEKMVKDSLDHAIAQINHAKALWKTGMRVENFAEVLQGAREDLTTFERLASIYDAANKK